MCIYFSHDVNAQRDPKMIRLLKDVGYEGVGIFWTLIERISETKECQLETDFDSLAWDMHLDSNKLMKVVYDYDLFVVDDENGFFWSESAKKRQELRLTGGKSVKKSEIDGDPSQPKRRRGRPRKYPLPEELVELQTPEQITETPAPDSTAFSEPVNVPVETSEPLEDSPAPSTPMRVLSCATSTPAVTGQIEPVEPQNKPIIYTPVNNTPESIPAQNEPAEALSMSQVDVGAYLNNGNYYEDDGQALQPQPVPAEEIIGIWNETFNNTPQRYRGFTLDPLSYENARQAFAQGYTIDDIRNAILQAKDDNFAWQLRNVLKPDNIQRLLTKGYMNEQRQSGQNRNLPDSREPEPAFELPDDFYERYKVNPKEVKYPDYRKFEPRLREFFEPIYKEYERTHGPIQYAD